MRRAYYVTYAPSTDETQPTLRAAHEQARTLRDDEGVDVAIFESREVLRFDAKRAEGEG